MYQASRKKKTSTQQRRNRQSSCTPRPRQHGNDEDVQDLGQQEKKDNRQQKQSQPSGQNTRCSFFICWAVAACYPSSSGFSASSCSWFAARRLWARRSLWRASSLAAPTSSRGLGLLQRELRGVCCAWQLEHIRHG